MSEEPVARAVIEGVLSIANGIVQGETDPYSGAKRLWSLQTDLKLLADDLRIFVGLASEWEDLPEQRSAFEQRIVVAADRLRATWGP